MLNATMISAKLKYLRSYIDIVEIGEPASAEAISAFSTTIGLELPESYRTFLRILNGFLAVSDSYYLCAIPTDSDEDPVPIDGLCGILSADERIKVDLDLPSAQSDYFFAHWVGLPWIVIGCSPSCHICIDGESGFVYSWGIETRPPSSDEVSTGPTRYPSRVLWARDEGTLIARSFEQFFNHLDVRKISLYL